ncbi:MAG: hypothetical protein HKP27_05370 [Myxococcales bacterium]|nr:hypothetical protein [Myxococcales bacterium]
MLRLLGIVVMLSSALASAPCGAADAAKRDETRAHMRGIAEDMKRVLPLWADRARLEDPKAAELLRATLESLIRKVDALERHGKQKGHSFELITRSLANDAHQMQAFLDERNDDAALFTIGPVLDSCVACHSRLPSEGTSSLGGQLTSGVDLEALETPDRLRLRLASRQFDDAVRDFESALAEGMGTAPRPISLHGALVDYLVVNLRIREDVKRPRDFLATLVDREDVGNYLRSEIDLWIRTLDRIPELTGPTLSIDQAKDLVNRGDQLRLFPADGVSLVYDIVASGILYRLLEEDRGKLSAREQAEAYYLLGAAESRIRRPTWNDRWDDYLEMAIRRAPGTDLSRNAYRMIETELIAFWAPTGPDRLPANIRERLETLRRLSETPKPER